MAGPPDFICIGAQKCATSSVFDWLAAQPAVCAPDAKEIHFFDNGFEKGLDSYRRNFPPTGPGQITGECTPSYLLIDDIPQRIHASLPDVKLFVCLRNPAERAFSQWKMNRRRGWEKRSFAEAIDASIRRGKTIYARKDLDDPDWRLDSHVPRGHYAVQLEPFLRLFPRESLHVLFFRDIVDRPRETLGGLASYLGFEPTEAPLPHILGSDEQPSDPETLDRLEAYFEEPNRALVELLGLPEPPNW